MRAIALHRDVLIATSEALQANCVVLRASVGEDREQQSAAGAGQETFVIDSPLLPGELGALPALIEQAGFAAPSGLLATHGDWDHLLGRLAFPGLALGCAESTAERLRDAPGEAQRELRGFDEGLLIGRERPLALGSLQPLPVPGSCALGQHELELHRAEGHTRDGMAILVPWLGVLVAGDYLSPLKLPTLGLGGTLAAYLETLVRLEGLFEHAEHVVPGHGPVLDTAGARAILAEDRAYLEALSQLGADARLPDGRRGPLQRRLHAQNVASHQRDLTQAQQR